MADHTLSGWIFDVYPSARAMTVWLIDEESRAHCLTDRLDASFFVAGPRAELRSVCELVRAARLPVTLRRAERYDIFLRREIELLEIVVNDPARFPLIVQTVTRSKPSLTYYNCDVALAQIYFYERNLFPLARVEVETDADHCIRAIQGRDSPWDLEYPLPPLKAMTLRLEGEVLNPNHGARGPLEIGVEDTTRVLRDDDPRELLIRVRELLQRYDPDVIISAWGDSFILPRLLEMSRRYRVPELGYSVCRRHRGLIPETLAPLIKKRSQYKKKVKALPKGAEKELYRSRVSCHKWLLVTCFGYLGYKNARFGKIEAHESVNAYGRDALLIAKEIAELRGFRMLHAIVDSLWLQKKNARDEEYEEIRRAVSEATQLPIELEGVYNWIAFLPSRQDPRLPVANRYFGAFRDGEVKIRGIEVRRSDTPPFIRRAQEEMVHLLATAANRAEFRERARDVLKLTLDYLDLLRAGQIPFDQLVITQHLSRDPTEYTKNNLNAIVARELLGRGVPLSPGESIHYVIVEQKAKAPSDRARAFEDLDGSFGYDVEKYAELFLRSVTTLFASLGVTQPMLEKYLGEWRVSLSRGDPLSPGTRPVELPAPGPAFGVRVPFRGPSPVTARPQLPPPQYAMPLLASLLTSRQFPEHAR